MKPGDQLPHYHTAAIATGNQTGAKRGIKRERWSRGRRGKIARRRGKMTEKKEKRKQRERQTGECERGGKEMQETCREQKGGMRKCKLS